VRQEQQRHLKTIVILAISTGMRRDEIRYLKWSDVLLDQQKAIIRNTKNGETRSVPLYALPRQSHTAAFSKTAGRQYVFTSHTKDEPIDFAPPFEWRGRMQDCMISGFTDLRHTTASYLAMNGATSADIAAVLGHKSIAMAQRYSHLSPSHMMAS
jgi:integrase